MRTAFIFGAATLVLAACTNNPQTNKELRCAGEVLGAATVGGVLGNQVGGGTGKSIAAAAGAGAGAAIATQSADCQ